MGGMPFPGEWLS